MVKKQKTIIHHLKKHPWDETMVIVVMVVSALCILIMLSSYVSNVGQAYSSLPSDQGVKNMLSNCEMVSGEGKSRGTVACGTVRKTCVLAWENEILKTCRDKINGKYRSLCCNPQFLIGGIPK